MNTTTTEAISYSIPAQRLFNWITTEISSTGGVTYRQVKKFVESNFYLFSKDLFEEIEEIIQMMEIDVDGKYVMIPDKRQMKRNRQSETTDSENGAKNAAEQTGEIPEAPPRKKVMRSPIILKSHTKAIEMAAVRRTPGNSSNINARRSSGDISQGETTASENGAKNAAGQTGEIPEAPPRKKVMRSPIILRSHTNATEKATVRPNPGSTSNTNARRNSGGSTAEKNAGPSIIDRRNVKRPNDVDITQQMEWMWKQDVLINDKLINFLVDTGSQLNIIPLYLFLDLELDKISNSNVCKSNGMIRSFGNLFVEIDYFVNLMCSTESVMNVKLQFAVVNHPVAPILGLGACELLKLVKRTDSKN